jgi:NADH:ubiquinone reductase (H+-translocating)
MKHVVIVGGGFAGVGCALEEADREPTLIEQGALNFVIVGGGATGCEIAGALAEMIHSTVTGEYEDLAVNSARIYLVERGPILLAPFSARAHEYASKVLHHDAVILKLNTAINEVHPGHVVLSDGSTIKTRSVIWGAGLRAAAVAGGSGLPKGRGAESAYSLTSPSRKFQAYMLRAISPT